MRMPSPRVTGAGRRGVTKRAGPMDRPFLRLAVGHGLPRLAMTPPGQPACFWSAKMSFLWFSGTNIRPITKVIIAITIGYHSP